MITRRSMVSGLSAAALIPASAAADDASVFVVRMHNVHPDDPTKRMVFSPTVIRLSPGDTVRFSPEDAGHNCQSTPGMIPTNARAWNGPFGKPFDVTLDAPGYYGYHCLPHRSMGMVGLIIVDGPAMDANLASARSLKHPGRAGDAWAEIWANLDS